MNDLTSRDEGLAVDLASSVDVSPSKFEKVRTLLIHIWLSKENEV